MTHIWIIAIVLLVAGSIVYPLLQIIPSKKQKQQMVFRQAAQKRGLKIQMRHPTLPHALINEYSHLSQTVGYSKMCEAKLHQSFVALKSNTPNEWFWINNQRPPANLIKPLLNSFEALPRFCFAVEQNGLGSTVFIKDALDIESLDELDKALTTLNQHLMTHS